jgi:methionine--tRNA ligase beta chain
LTLTITDIKLTNKIHPIAIYHPKLKLLNSHWLISKMSIFLTSSPASNAISLFIHLNHLESTIKIHKAQDNAHIHIETHEGKFYGPITICRYLNTLAKDKSFLSRKDDFEFALIHQWMNFASHDLTKNLSYLNKVIQNGTFFVGNSISFADLFMYFALESHVVLTLYFSLI